MRVLNVFQFPSCFVPESEKLITNKLEQFRWNWYDHQLVYHIKIYRNRPDLYIYSHRKLNHRSLCFSRIHSSRFTKKEKKNPFFSLLLNT